MNGGHLVWPDPILYREIMRAARSQIYYTSAIAITNVMSGLLSNKQVYIPCLRPIPLVQNLGLAPMGRLWEWLLLAVLTTTIYRHTSGSGVAAMLCSYGQGNRMLSYQTKCISHCFPCGLFGISEPAIQHLVLAADIVSTVFLIKLAKQVPFQLQLHT